MVNKKIFLIIVYSLFLLHSILADCNSTQININTASAEELDEIIGVGSSTAQNIINSRPFNSLDDLMNVSGIAEIKLQKIKDQGLACVENSEENNNSNNTIESLNKSEENNSNEEINIDENKSEITRTKKKNITLNKINLNSKDINTHKNNSWIKNYILYGLIIFSILIIILLIIKKIRRRKNEFE